MLPCHHGDGRPPEQTEHRNESNPVTLRVAIADDSLLVREGLRHVLEGIPELELVAVCEEAHSLVEAIER